MNSKTAHLLWFLYRFPQRFFKLGTQLNLCFDDSSKSLKTDQEILVQGLTMQEVKAWRRMESGLYREVLAWLEDPLNQLISYDDELYPALLRTIKDPPLLLFCRGNCRLLGRPQLAIVGSRTPSCYGRQVVQEWVSQIARQAVVISSGFAYGIDYLAHHSALTVGGSSVAVLGSGLIDIYPRAHRDCWSVEQLTQQALMVSEFPLHFPVRPWLFPYRNRIISGLSRAVLVIEARIKSGTLITARLAAEQGREVMAVPGSVHNPLSAGCHWLLQQGEAIGSSAEEVMDMLRLIEPGLPSGNGLGVWVSAPKQNAGSELTCKDDVVNKEGNIVLEYDTQKLLDCLEFGAVNSVEEILQRTGLDLLELKQRLASLEDGGWVQELVDGYVRLK